MCSVSVTMLMKRSYDGWNRRVVVGTEELMLEKKKIRRPNSMDSEVK